MVKNTKYYICRITYDGHEEFALGGNNIRVSPDDNLYFITLLLSVKQRFPAMEDFMINAHCNETLKEIGKLTRCKRAFCNESVCSSTCSVWLYFVLILISCIL